MAQTQFGRGAHRADIFKAQHEHFGKNKKYIHSFFLEAPFIDSESFSWLWDIKMYYG